ncbi:unnamed protein product [Prunus armeniaca]
MSDETWPFQSMNRCHGREEVPSYDRDLLGTNTHKCMGLAKRVVCGWSQALIRPFEGSKGGGFGLIGSTKTYAHFLEPNRMGELERATQHLFV